MAWLRLDDKFAHHPKIVSLSDRAYRVHVNTMLYCAEYKTEGRVPTSALRMLGATLSLVEKFVKTGLWEQHEDGRLYIHDFEHYNPNDSTNAARQARFRAKRNANRNGEVTESVTPDVTDDVTPRAQARARVPVPSPSNSLSHVGTDDPDPEKERAWIDYAESRPDIHNPGAYARKGYDSGEWPPGHEAQPVREPCPDCGIELHPSKLADHLRNIHEQEPDAVEF